MMPLVIRHVCRALRPGVAGNRRSDRLSDCRTRRLASSQARASKPQSSARRVIPPITSPPSRPEEGKAFWQAEVQKMIKVYKAPIAESDAAIIVDYLAATY